MKSRHLRQAYFIDDQIASCGIHAHLLYLGLLGLADREGRLEDRPFPIKVQILPYYECDINELLDVLSDAGLIIRYDGFIQIESFLRHQKPHPKEANSLIPAPKNIAIPCKGWQVSNLGVQVSNLDLETNHNHSHNHNSISNSITDKDTTVSTVESDSPTKPPSKQKPKAELVKLGSHFRANREQIESLILEDGESAFTARVQTINDYCAANGKTYKDYPAAYRNFRKRDKEKQVPRYESRTQRNERVSREIHEKLTRQEKSTNETTASFLEGVNERQGN